MCRLESDYRRFTTSSSKAVFCAVISISGQRSDPTNSTKHYLSQDMVHIITKHHLSQDMVHISITNHLSKNMVHISITKHHLSRHMVRTSVTSFTWRTWQPERGRAKSVIGGAHIEGWARSVIGGAHIECWARSVIGGART
ncbi:uncharacterized [Tachysurus ichikawai]